MSTRTILALLIAFALACGGTPTAPTAPAPQAETTDGRVALVEQIYRGYEEDRPPDLRALPWSRAITAGFAALQARDEMGLGFDPLIGGQDFQIDQVQVTLAPDGRVEARFRNFEQPMVVRWTFIEEDGGLRIGDLDTADGTLRAMLSL